MTWYFVKHRDKFTLPFKALVLVGELAVCTRMPWHIQVAWQITLTLNHWQAAGCSLWHHYYS